MVNAYREGCEQCKEVGKHLSIALAEGAQHRVALLSYRDEAQVLRSKVRELEGRKPFLWFGQAVGLTLLIGGLLIILADVYGEAKRPKPVAECADSTRVLSGSELVTCHSTATLSSEKLGMDSVLVTCRCPRPGGVPSASPPLEVP